ALRAPVVREDPVPRGPGRDRLFAVRRRQGGRVARDLGGGRARDPGVFADRDRPGPAGAARSGRLGNERDGRPDPGALRELPDLAQGARRRLPDVAPAPVDALVAATCGPAGALRGLAGDPRLLPRARIRVDRLADPDGLLGRGDVDALRDRLL